MQHLWEEEVTFQDLMAERLKQAPWLVLSIGLHLVAFLLLWVLIPPEQKRAVANHVQMVHSETTELVVPTPPPEVVTKPEPVPDDTVITEQPAVSESDDAALDNADSDSTAKEPSLDVNSLNSPVGLGPGTLGPYGKRGPGGGGKQTGQPYAPNIAPGLQWLANHQDDDGKWDCDGFQKHDDPSSEICSGLGNATHDVGVTGLALLAFLGEGSTMRSGSYAPVIKKGVHWLRKQQDPSTGLFGTKASHDYIYDHAIATYAVCEAVGLSPSEMLRPIAQNGINYLESHRNPYSVWRYQPRDDQNDTSVTGWCIMAYESGAFFGLTVNKEALKLCELWLDQVSDSTGLHGYTRTGEKSARKGSEHAAKFPVDKGEAMTAVGLFSRFFLGQDPKEKPVMKAAADRLLACPPIWDEKAGTIDHYYWYYATYALFQMGGKHWNEWQKKLETSVVKHQHLDPKQKNLYGSWDPVDAWGEDGGRVYSTAILVLTLEALHRYTRLVR
ncbi:MAG: terpene cyclase/mutase family protein [Planctomycetes bacterium]|nr:terpene cyclase/mutase family protein [Planctomycetota bacterium]